MAAVSRQDRDALRAAMPEVLRRRCGIQELNGMFRCLNPAHEDRNPSAKYFPDSNTVHCFGCGCTWDVFELVGMLDGIEGFTNQAQAVADLVGYDLGCHGKSGAPARRASRRPSKEIIRGPKHAGGEDCAQRCYEAYDRLYTPQGDVARRYLHMRGFDDVDIARYGLGFAMNPGEIMSEFKVYEPGCLGFVMIPFYDSGYETANYCMARTIAEKPKHKEWRPKGLTSPLWREWLLTSGQAVVYVTEGLLDAMALEKRIDKLTVALGGTSNASRLASVLAGTTPDKRPKKVMVAMDEDEAGRKAAERISHDLDVVGIPHGTMPPYPDGAKDADDWLMADKGKRWVYDEIPIGEGLTPLHVTRRL